MAGLIWIQASASAIEPSQVTEAVMTESSPWMVCLEKLGAGTIGQRSRLTQGSAVSFSKERSQPNACAPRAAYSRFAQLTQPRPSASPSLASTETEDGSQDPPALTVNVKQFSVEGSTVFNNAQLTQAVAPFIGSGRPLSDLQAAADAVTQLYLNEGYITSEAILPPQDIVDGIVRLQIIEGFLEEIRVEGSDRMADYVRARVRLAGISPLNQISLEEQLQLLKQDPLFDNVEGNLRQGSTPGGSILIVRVVEAPPFSGNIATDTLSPRSVGLYRIGSTLVYRNLAGLGDTLLASAYRTTSGGANAYELSYQLPINPMHGSLLFRLNPSDFRITDSSEPSFALGLSGATDIYEIQFRQPLIRRPQEELALSVGFRHRNGSTVIAGIITDPAITSVISLGQDYQKQDRKGIWAFNSQFRIGTGLLDATQREAPLPDGRFFSWLGQVQRLQVINPNNHLVITGNVQLTPDSLLGAEQFFIGGGQSVRGYYQNARFGDNGLQLSIEDRITVYRDPFTSQPLVQVSPFIDFGYVWYNNPDLQVTNQNILLGTGAGVTLNPVENLSTRIDFGLSLLALNELTSDRPNGLRVYFDIRYQF